MANENPFLYDETAANNTEINGIDINEGMAPSKVNNAKRELLAQLRKVLNDILGGNVSSGNDTITLTTASTLTAYEDGVGLGFIAGGTNTGAATLNVDSVGAKAIRKGADQALGAGDIVAGMPCLVFYDESANSAAGAWMLLNPAGVLDDELSAIAGLTSAANKIIRFTGSGTADLLDFLDEDDFSSDSATGVPSQQSVKAYVTGQHTIGVPAGAMLATETNGAESTEEELATNDVMLKFLAFDDSTRENACFQIQMPKGWDEGTLVCQFVWKTGATSGNVIWGIEAVAFADDDALDTAFGTAQEVTDAAGSAGDDALISSETSALTVAGSPSAEEFVVFKVYRDAADGSDTLTGDAELLSVKIHYTTDTPTDS